jgi:hypothetical protein
MPHSAATLLPVMPMSMTGTKSPRRIVIRLCPVDPRCSSHYWQWLSCPDVPAASRPHSRQTVQLSRPSCPRAETSQRRTDRPRVVSRSPSSLRATARRLLRGTKPYCLQAGHRPRHRLICGAIRRSHVRTRCGGGIVGTVGGHRISSGLDRADRYSGYEKRATRRVRALSPTTGQLPKEKRRSALMITFTRLRR